MNISKKINNDLKLFFVLVFLFGFLIIFNRIYREKKLQTHTKETFAIFIGYNGGVGNSRPFFKFITFKKNIIEVGIPYNKSLKIGDTVWIKYSKEKPEIAEIIDADYKKHKKNR